ncbi:hypothetical protein Leryth_008137 [Lithospermum erythrorhizon]|nr:hypothetical protein Leryth_008137 [Lithospermum erythrorhizon]
MSKELSGILKVFGNVRKSKVLLKKKKGNKIFAPMSVAHVDDDDLHKNVEVYNIEKVFQNGDMYTGQWGDGLPNGNGKYLWNDGCMYVGDWENGKKNGRGKFSWPSGATYEGQFKNGYMDGEGIYIGPSNDTYKGSWVYNMKQGKGTMSYENGDHYAGEWRRGRPSGQGRYLWQNGNQYIGQWRHRKMHGNGTMMWSNGNRFDGCWEDGLPKGNGTFRWADGSFYVGVWTRNPKEHTGTYYPSDSQSGDFDWDPQELYDVHLVDCKVSRIGRIRTYPSEKIIIWHSEGEDQNQEMDRTPKANDGEFLRSPKNERVRIGGGLSIDSESDLGSDGTHGFLPPVAVRRGDEEDEIHSYSNTGTPKESRLHQVIIKPPKRQGMTISKGHKNYELMLNLQLGIRHSVGRPAPASTLDLRSTAFNTRDKLWTKFPPEGSKHTPPHHSCEFKWKDYCPLVFRTLRKLFKVDPADYMISICGDDALRELSSPGKSGSFFYLTDDDRYMIKTMKKSEVKVLLRMLPDYYKHLRTFENSLVTKFYGLHCVKMTGPTQKKVRFVIMGNLFCSGVSIHRRFDLKGSSLGRLTDKPESQIDSTTILKDLDLNYIFRLQKSLFQEFCSQLHRDSDFLEHARIMDYSLLVGIHFRKVSETGEPISVPRYQGTHTPSNRDFDSRGPLGIHIPALAELTARRKNDGEVQLVGEPTGECYEVILYFGIIDILQDYDISKKLEHAYKSFQYDPTSISAVDPIQYSRRFRDFIFRIFADDT